MSDPWFKFSPSSWRASPELRMCSMAARGLWMEMLCIMHDAEPRGYLSVGAMQVSSQQLANLAGLSLKECTSLLAELEAANVFSRDNLGVFSRRMRKDTKRAERDKANGREGGNPKLSRGLTPPIKLTGAQEPEPELDNSLREFSPTAEKPPPADFSDSPKPDAKPKRGKPKTAIPADAQPTHADLQHASETSVNSQIEWPKFRDHHLAKGNLMADWGAAWRTWCRNSKSFAQARAGPTANINGNNNLVEAFLNLGRPHDQPGDDHGGPELELAAG